VRAAALGILLLALAGGARAQIAGWNAHSRQLIDPPVFALLARPDAAQYRATVVAGESRWTVTAPVPRLELKKIWKNVPVGAFTLRLEWLDREGKALQAEDSARVKAAGWRGFREKPADWAAAADRALAYFIRQGGQGNPVYREPGVPVWIWEASPRHPLNYPALQYPLYIRACLAAARHGRPQAREALQCARTIGDWLLTHRRPAGGKLPLFPYSTITAGQYGGGIEGNAVTLLRAAYMGTALVELSEATSSTAYLEYARQIAGPMIPFQQPDGSFPYRVDGQTGAILGRYSAGAIDFVELDEALARHGFDPARALAAARAWQWMLAYPATTMFWNTGYEDIQTIEDPKVNLTQWSAMQTIRHLLRHREENPQAVELAERLNRWIEDQFVLFGTARYTLPGMNAPIEVKGPLVYEQFACWFPMEGHTGNWILTLIELHKATGEKAYLEKAQAAANAICAAQYAYGSFCTFGRDWRTGQPDPPLDGQPGNWNNWYSCTCLAIQALYELDAYMRTLREN
jgi:hypothetical protein